MLHHLGAIVLICAVGVEALKLPSSFLAVPSIDRFKTKISASTTSEQAQSGIGWDSHEAIESIPESLVKSIDGNESMRRKFEQLCRRSQVRRSSYSTTASAASYCLSDEQLAIHSFIHLYNAELHLQGNRGSGRGR